MVKCDLTHNIIVFLKRAKVNSFKEFFEIIFKEICVKNKKEVLMIGDTFTSDILGANNAGIDSCLVDIHKISNPEIVPTYKIEKTIDLLEL